MKVNVVNATEEQPMKFARWWKTRHQIGVRNYNYEDARRSGTCLARAKHLARAINAGECTRGSSSRGGSQVPRGEISLGNTVVRLKRRRASRLVRRRVHRRKNYRSAQVPPVLLPSFASLSSPRLTSASATRCRECRLAPLEASRTLVAVLVFPFSRPPRTRTGTTTKTTSLSLARSETPSCTGTHELFERVTWAENKVGLHSPWSKNRPAPRRIKKCDWATRSLAAYIISLKRTFSNRST